MALKEVLEGRAKEATVWRAYRPGDLAPRWVEVATIRDDAESEDSKLECNEPGKGE